MTTLTKSAMQEAYEKLLVQLEAAEPKQIGTLREAFQDLYGVSKDTVYRNLKKLGWQSGRKKRVDAGTTSVDEATLVEIESMSRLSVRANGKSTMPTTVATSVLASNGRNINVSNSRINQLRQQRNSTVKQLTGDGAFQRMRSTHPNHVHQVDPSYCLLYYPPNSKKVRTQKFVDESEFYANKPDNLEKIKHLKCWRYVLTDHFSGSIIVRYFESAGETSDNLWLFLLYCWQTLENRMFRGVPDIMVWDKGSANTSKAIKNALKALQIKEIAHAAKNARAKGQVECGNNIVECHFESRLKFEPVNSVAELNAAAEHWYNAFNANLVPHQDTRLNRRGMSKKIARNDLWQTILRMQNKLRELPPIEICQYLLRAEPIARKVTNSLDINFKHPRAKSSLVYSVSNLHGIAIGDKVLVSPLFYGNQQIMVTLENALGEEQHHVLEPMQFDEAGFAIEAAIWGEEIKSQPDTAEVKRQKSADAAAFPELNQEDIKKAKQKQATPFNGELVAHSNFKDIEQPAFMRKKGVAIDLPNQFAPAERKPLSAFQLKRLVADQLGRNLETHEATFLNEYKEVFDEDVPNVISELTFANASPLQLVK